MSYPGLNSAVDLSWWSVILLIASASSFVSLRLARWYSSWDMLAASSSPPLDSLRSSLGCLDECEFWRTTTCSRGDLLPALVIAARGCSGCDIKMAFSGGREQSGHHSGRSGHALGQSFFHISILILSYRSSINSGNKVSMALGFVFSLKKSSRRASQGIQSRFFHTYEAALSTFDLEKYIFLATALHLRYEGRFYYLL